MNLDSKSCNSHEVMMNKNLKLLIVCPAFILVLFGGCATKPEAIPPSYVSHLGYMNLSADQLAQEQARLVAALSAASDAQRTARSNDIAGVIFLGLPVSSLSGSNQASNIGRLKGELDACHKAMIEKGAGNKVIPIDQIIEDSEKKQKEQAEADSNSLPSKALQPRSLQKRQ
jgi:hypothetical protein